MLTVKMPKVLRHCVNQVSDNFSAFFPIKLIIKCVFLPSFTIMQMYKKLILKKKITVVLFV